MYTEGLFVRAHAAPWTDTIDIAVIDHGRRGHISVAGPLMMHEHKEGTVIDRCLSLQNEAAQKLMDDLWDAGLRPSEGSGSAGSLAATQKHLADMKQIAYHALKIAIK